MANSECDAPFCREGDDGDACVCPYIGMTEAEVADFKRKHPQIFSALTRGKES